MTDRSTIIEKIRALRAKAEDHAATEAEAMTAAEMAARLLVKHDIKPEELAEVAKSEGTISGFRQGLILHPVADYTAIAIARFTETKAYNSKGEIKYIGLEEDVLMAVYLTEMLVGAGKRGWVAYADEQITTPLPFKQMESRRFAYFMGFSTRVSDRLNELKAYRDAARKEAQGTSNATALVVVKDAIIKKVIEEQGLSFSKRRDKSVYMDPATWRAGHMQGDNVNLGRPFAGNPKTQGELT